MNNEEIHNLLKIENDKTTIFTNKELKIKNDYINELEAYKYNLDRDYLRLEKENKELKEQNETIQEKFKEWKKDIEKERKFYLCERDCAFRLKESKKYLSYTQQIEKLKQENQELKEQVDYLRRSIERKEEIIIDLQNERIPYTNEYVAKLENQQKYFIEYLTSYIKLLSDDPDYIEERQKDILEEILSEYEEIIYK